MVRSFLPSLRSALAVLFMALPATAQYPRDAAANRNIQEAINKHYLATNLDEAERVLLDTVAACEEKCRPQTLARAWMYVGVVRGSGRNDIAGAKEAFVSALSLDAAVKLDTGLATPETQEAFQSMASVVAGDAGQTAATPADEPEAPATTVLAEDSPPASTGGLNCTPTVTEVETKRPIPVQCRAQQAVAKVTLLYQPVGTQEWKSVSMPKQGDSYRAVVPCEHTAFTGLLKLYVRAEDATGEDVGAWGNKAQPNQMTLVERSTQPPPRYDDAEPPARCGTEEDCPPDFPGCGAKKGGTTDWGGGCSNSSECMAGLLCIDGTCETAPSCSEDEDCPTGVCVEGQCTAAGEKAAGGGAKAKNWFGLHVAQDAAFVGGTDVCGQAYQTNNFFACYYAGSSDRPFVDEPYPGVTIGTGLVLATTRLMLSYDRALSRNITLGLRLGYAFRGGPPSGREVVYDESGAIAEEIDPGSPFLPFHAEARGTYWFGTDTRAHAIRPYAHLGGGLAQVDAKVEIPVRDCGAFADPGSSDYEACAQGDDDLDVGDIPRVKVDAWKKAGLTFVTAGGGAVYYLVDEIGLQLNLNLMVTLPSTALVLQPSLGAVMGF